jgi:hypothetical protein
MMVDGFVQFVVSALGPVLAFGFVGIAARRGSEGQDSC